MNKFKKSEVLMLSLLLALLIITPLLPSSLRSPFLYFVINLLIIALGADAGLLSGAFSKPAEDKKHSVSLAPKPEASFEAKVVPARTEKNAKVVEKSASEKIVSVVEVDKVKKCPSMPSLFFIGGGETEAEDVVVAEEYKEEEEEEVGELSGQELCNQAEMFIGNFYKQLKMQKEDSWKRIHGFYQKAF